MIIYVIIHIILGIFTVCLLAYDPFSRTFDFFEGNWIVPNWIFIILWLVVVVLFPIFLVQDGIRKWSQRKAVQQWRKTGTATIKLK